MIGRYGHRVTPGLSSFTTLSKSLQKGLAPLLSVVPDLKKPTLKNSLFYAGVTKTPGNIS